MPKNERPMKRCYVRMDHKEVGDLVWRLEPKDVK